MKGNNNNLDEEDDFLSRRARQLGTSGFSTKVKRVEKTETTNTKKPKNESEKDVRNENKESNKPKEQNPLPFMVKIQKKERII